MPNDSLSTLRVVVAGGSIGGLCASLALHGNGANVDIFERHSGPMESRGAGIVVQGQLTEFLQRHDAPPLSTTSCRVRRYLASRPETGSGEFELPMVTSTLRSIRR